MAGGSGATGPTQVNSSDSLLKAILDWWMLMGKSDDAAFQRADAPGKGEEASPRQAPAIPGLRLDPAITGCTIIPGERFRHQEMPSLVTILCAGAYKEGRGEASPC